MAELIDRARTLAAAAQDAKLRSQLADQRVADVLEAASAAAGKSITTEAQLKAWVKQRTSALAKAERALEVELNKIESILQASKETE